MNETIFILQKDLEDGNVEYQVPERQGLSKFRAPSGSDFGVHWSILNRIIVETPD